MKIRILIILIVLLYIVPTNAQVVSVNKNANDCYFTFIIDPKIENDIFFRQQLSCYIYNAMIDNCCVLDSMKLEDLYNRTSFKKTLLYVLNNDNNALLDVFYENNNDSHYRWSEYSINLLYNCTNYEAKCLIVNELLKCNNNKGIVAMWNDIEPNMLPCLTKYIEQNLKMRNYYLLAELACALYNKKHLKLYNRILRKIEKQDNAIAKKISFLTKNNDYINYIEYIEYMYN